MQLKKQERLLFIIILLFYCLFFILHTGLRNVLNILYGVYK